MGIRCARRAANIRTVVSTSAQRESTLDLQEEGLVVKAIVDNKVDALIVNEREADSQRPSDWSMRVVPTSCSMIRPFCDSEIGMSRCA